MDRSFLSQAEVVTASRAFVCVRLATYEDKAEADLLKTIFVGRSGEVENTTFTVLSSDRKKQLVRASRSARHSFGSAAALAETMSRLARQNPSRKAEGAPELPKATRVRLALDMAAADNQPLVVLFGRDGKALQEMEGRLRKLAWSADFIGQAVYAATTERDQLKAIEGAAASSGLLVIQPDLYGLKGKVLAQAAGDASANDLVKTLRAGIGLHKRIEKSFENHVREGHRTGIFWETAIPVTDPMEKRARDQGRNMRR
jgi:hypothetical protein